MVETPAAVEIIEEIAPLIDFISFGTNDLTQYTLAIDRGNEEVQYLYDEMHPAVLFQLKRVIDVCKENKVESSICGQAGSRKEMVKFLVEAGIDSISVNADMARDISVYVRELEREKGVDSGEGEEKEEEKEESGEEKSDEIEQIKEELDEEIEKNTEIIEEMGLEKGSKEESSGESVEELGEEILQEPKEEKEGNEEETGQEEQEEKEEQHENISEELGEELKIF